MSSRAFDFAGISGMRSPPLRGGEGGNNTAVIALTIAVIVLIVVMLVCVLCNCCMSSSSGMTGGSSPTGLAARISNAFKPSKKGRSRLIRSPATSPRSQHAARAPNNNNDNNNRVRRNVRMGMNGYTSSSAGSGNVPSAPLPASQLMTQDVMDANSGTGMDYMTSSSVAIGESEMARASTESGGSSANTYVDSSYTMDSGMMTPASTTDIQGLKTFMPMMSDGVGSAGGPVDPSTGLPLFTTGKLVRSQLLGGHGAGSFLRQQQDPLSGYKRLGKNMCGAQNARRDLTVRRAQFNEARLSDPNGDPVLFQTSEFAYY